MSLSRENIIRFWNTLLEKYFATNDSAKIDDIKEIFKAFAYLRAALFPMKHVQISEEAKKFFVENARKNFFPNIDWALKKAEALKSIEI